MTEDDLRTIICKRFLGGDLDFPLDRDMRLLEEGICDSLGLVQIAAEIEKRHPGMKIQDQEITHGHFGSIAAMMQFIEQKKRALAGGTR